MVTLLFGVTEEALTGRIVLWASVDGCGRLSGGSCEGVWVGFGALLWGVAVVFAGPAVAVGAVGGDHAIGLEPFMRALVAMPRLTPDHAHVYIVHSHIWPFVYVAHRLLYSFAATACTSS
jgi:hypothetical protein